jgi:hypothetical protein
MLKKFSLHTFPLSCVRILLGSDDGTPDPQTHTSLARAGFRVDTASDYASLESVWHAERHEIVLIEVSRQESILAALSLASRLKKYDIRQFIGLLADPAMHDSVPTGTTVFPRDAIHLPQALRRFFGPQMA